MVNDFFLLRKAFDRTLYGAVRLWHDLQDRRTIFFFGYLKSVVYTVKRRDD